MVSKTFTSFISLDSRFIRINKDFYNAYHENLPPALTLETATGTSFPASLFLDPKGVPFINTNTVAVMDLFGVNGFIGAPTRRSVQLTYTSVGCFKIHIPMTAGRLRPAASSSVSSALDLWPSRG